jgi:multicomponent Na+:H+ antiporter subunit E
MPALTGAVVGGLLWRLSIFTLLWWILTEGRREALLFGAPFIVAAALLSVVFKGASLGRNGHGRISLSALGRLIPFFLWHSLRGGIDVGIRAFKPSLPLAPDLVDYPLRLPSGPAAVLMAGLVSLMPGTLAVIWDGRLRVHVLDRGGHFWRDLERLEEQVGAVFGLQLADSPGPSVANPPDQSPPDQSPPDRSPAGSIPARSLPARPAAFGRVPPSNEGSSEPPGGS